MFATYSGRLLALTISDQDLSVNHSGAGLGKGFSKATPPVNKKVQTSSTISPLKKKIKIKNPNTDKNKSTSYFRSKYTNG